MQVTILWCHILNPCLVHSISFLNFIMQKVNANTLFHLFSFSALLEPIGLFFSNFLHRPGNYFPFTTPYRESSSRLRLQYEHSESFTLPVRCWYPLTEPWYFGKMKIQLAICNAHLFVEFERKIPLIFPHLQQVGL